MRRDLKPDRTSKEARMALAIATYLDVNSWVTNINSKLRHDTVESRYAYLETGTLANPTSVETTDAGNDTAHAR